MIWGHCESTPKVAKHKWLVHVEKNPYVAFQVCNPKKHHLYKKFGEAQEQVPMWSYVEDICNWHGPNAHAKVCLLNLHVLQEKEPVSLEDSNPSNL